MQLVCSILWRHLWPHHTFPHYLTNGTIFEKQKVIEHKMCQRPDMRQTVDFRNCFANSSTMTATGRGYLTKPQVSVKTQITGERVLACFNTVWTLNQMRSFRPTRCWRNNRHHIAMSLDMHGELQLSYRLHPYQQKVTPCSKTRQAMYVYRNNEARSRNHCCSGKAV